MQFGDKIGERVIYKSGAFTRKLMWFSGWDRKLAQEYRTKRAVVKFINGYTGQETQVTVDEIRPSVIFDS